MQSKGVDVKLIKDDLKIKLTAKNTTSAMRHVRFEFEKSCTASQLDKQLLKESADVLSRMMETETSPDKKDGEVTAFIRNCIQRQVDKGEIKDIKNGEKVITEKTTDFFRHLEAELKKAKDESPEKLIKNVTALANDGINVLRNKGEKEAITNAFHSFQCDEIISEYIDDKVELKDMARMARTSMIGALRNYWKKNHDVNNFREVCRVAQSVLSIRQKYDNIKTPSNLPWGQSSAKMGLMHELESCLVTVLENAQPIDIGKSVVGFVDATLTSSRVSDQKSLYDIIFATRFELSPVCPSFTKNFPANNKMKKDAHAVRNKMILALLSFREKNPEISDVDFNTICQIARHVLLIRQKYDRAKLKVSSNPIKIAAMNQIEGEMLWLLSDPKAVDSQDRKVFLEMKYQNALKIPTCMATRMLCMVERVQTTITDKKTFYTYLSEACYALMGFTMPKEQSKATAAKSSVVDSKDDVGQQKQPDAVQQKQPMDDKKAASVSFATHRFTKFGSTDSQGNTAAAATSTPAAAPVASMSAVELAAVPAASALSAAQKKS